MGGFTKAQNKAFSASNLLNFVRLIGAVTACIVAGRWILNNTFWNCFYVVWNIDIHCSWIKAKEMAFSTSDLLKLFWLLYSCRTCNYTACNAGRRILNNISENSFLRRLQYWYPLYSHVKSFCVNQKWKSSWRTSFSTNLQRSCWHCNVLWINENYAVLVLFSKLIEIKPSFSKGCSLHMQLQWRLPWFQPLPQILIKITIGRGIAGGSHAIASIFHNSQRRAAILFRQFTLVSLPFQKVTFSLFIFCIFVFNIFSSNFPNSCEAIQSYFTSARYYYSQRFVTDFLTFCCFKTPVLLYK